MTGMPHAKRLEPGTKFGSFTFINYTRSVSGGMRGMFKCELCNEERERVVSHVRTGYTKRCNCQGIGRPKQHGHASHDRSTPTYEAWRSMKKRCLNPAHHAYNDYGGRGIGICEAWMSFQAFLADMGECPEGMTLDRRDNSLGYSADNCRWVTMSVQNNNKRSNSILSFQGKSLTISEWAAATGIKDCTLSERLRRGWSVEKCLTTPPRKYRTRAA
ncbi:hypothetical protein D3C80_682590 [compost metagenome]